MENINNTESLQELFKRQKKAFAIQPYPAMKHRLENLSKLKKMILDNQSDFINALNSDFGNRAEDDSMIGDFLSTVGCINYSISNLKSWMKPSKRHVSVLFQPATARVEYQPLGVVGIMVPWNYPIFLALGPLVTALAAGNRALIKMSEFTPATSSLLNKLITNTFNADEVAVIEGDASVASEFSKLRFDHIFFTGSTTVGKYVMKAAAENLVPVTLELGGKSPAIIAPEMDLTVSVERLIMGKTLNCGQTCVAPDYILCPKGKSTELVEALSVRFNKMFPSVNCNKDYTSVVTDAQYNRLQGLITDAQDKGATVISLNKSENADANDKSRQMPLTVVLNGTDDMDVMKDEIFGPILPIIEYDSINQAIDYINERERPLALYIYSFDEAMQDRILKNTHSGGVCINEAAFHVAVDDLPFGGVGASGMGNYHGIEGFKTFSHAKSILKRGKISVAKVLFPPYGKAIHKLIYKLFIR